MASQIKNYPIDPNFKGSRDLKPLPSAGNYCQSTEIKVLKKDEPEEVEPSQPDSKVDDEEK